MERLTDFALDRPEHKALREAYRDGAVVALSALGIGLVGAFLWLTGRLLTARWYLWPVQFVWPMGFIAILAGWWVTESGRQPWIATGILRTADALSPVSLTALAISLSLFVIVYVCVFSMGILYINRLIEKGPAGKALDVTGDEAGASRPLAAAAKAAKAALDPGKLSPGE